MDPQDEAWTDGQIVWAGLWVGWAISRAFLSRTPVFTSLVRGKAFECVRVLSTW